MSTSENQSGKQRLLSVLAPTIRGACYNFFLLEVRRGVTDPAEIVCNVLSALARRTTTAQGTSLQNAHAMLFAVRDDMEGAKECARAALQHDARPVEERQAEREHGRREGVARWMERQKPSENQITYLRSLGCFDDPASMLSASELIEQIKGRRR